MIRWRCAFFVVLFCLTHVSSAFALAQITAVTLDTSSDGKTRIILTLNQKPRYTVFALDRPNRAVIDFETVQLRTRLPSSGGDATPIARLRSGKRASQGLRLVADLKTPVRLNSTLNNTGSAWQLVVELTAPGQSKTLPVTVEEETEEAEETNNDDDVELAFQKAAKLLPQKTKEKSAQKKNTPIKTPTETTFRPPSSKQRLAEKPPENTIEAAPIPPQPNNAIENVLHEEIFPSRDKNLLPDRYLAKRDVIIVIDAGHGGKDPGAVNPNGTREKDVTLAIAQRLQQLLHQEPGIRAILTRPNDTYIGLRTRLNVARKHKADVFVSIHADAFKTPQASGASVFALSPGGASSEAARWLAEKENTSELGEVNLDDKGAALRSVLLDLSQTATISLSVQLGSHVLSQLGLVTQVRQSAVEQARFMVLKSPDIPSILVETGFISNAEEAKRLRDPVYQARIATALKTGLRRHFIKYPPPGTMLAVQHNKSMKHVVGNGETLAQVAKRYEITPDALRQHNQLKSYRVSAGQVLYIPTG